MGSLLGKAKCFAVQLNVFKPLGFLDSEIMLSHIYISVTNNALNDRRVNTKRLHLTNRTGYWCNGVDWPENIPS